jgi:hypothetical protein
MVAKLVRMVNYFISAENKKVRVTQGRNSPTPNPRARKKGGHEPTLIRQN